MITIKNKLLLSGLVLLSGAIIQSCSDDDNYTPGPDAGTVEVYFPSTQSTTIYVNEQETNYSITVVRVNTSDAITVPVTTNITYVSSSSATPAPGKTDYDKIFSFPPSVSFAAGEKQATYEFTCDASDFAYNTDQYQVQISLDEGYVTPYGSSSLMFLISKPLTWKPLGTGTFVDAGWWISDDSSTASVQFEQCEQDENRFRITNPYEWYKDYPSMAADANTYFEFTVLQEGQTYLGQTVPETGLVAYPDFRIDKDDDGFVYLVFPGRFGSLGDPSNWVYNYVAEYQEDGTPAIVVISPMYYVFNEQGVGQGGWNYTTSEFITIAFPGVQLIDSSVQVAYAGMLTTPSNSLEVIAYVKLGDDVEEAVVGVVQGSNVTNASLNDILAGNVETVTVTESGNVNIPFDADNAPGKYTVVAISFVDGEPQEYAAVTFSYGETWNYVTEGLYTYLEFWESALGLEPEVLELYESEQNPGSFKIEYWLGGEDFEFTMEDDGSIYVAPDQFTGITGSDGPIYVDDFSLWGDPDESYYEDGVYNFAVMYYDSYGIYDYGYETFEPATVGTSAQTASLKAAKMFKSLDTKKVNITSKKFNDKKGQSLTSEPRALKKSTRVQTLKK